MKAMVDTEEQMVKEVGRSAFGSSARVAKSEINSSVLDSGSPRPVLIICNPEDEWRATIVSKANRIMAPSKYIC